MVAAEHSAATYRKDIFESQFGKLVFEDALHVVFKEGKKRYEFSFTLL